MIGWVCKCWFLFVRCKIGLIRSCSVGWLGWCGIVVVVVVGILMSMVRILCFGVVIFGNIG